MYYNSSDKGYLRTATTRDSSGRSGCCTVTVNVPVESVKVNDERRIMYTGTTDRFEVTVCPHNATNKLVRWSSTNTNVATVDPATGKVTAISAGTARIIATAQDGTGKSGACELTVKPAIPVEGVTICSSTYTMKVGETTRLSYSVYPVDATNQRVTWCSSDPNVAEVGSRNRKITAKRAGKTTITVTTDDGNFVASCEVTVISWYKYVLINLCGFSEAESDLIMSLYDRVDRIYSSDTTLERAWRCARVLSEFCYDYLKHGINMWDCVAGSVTKSEDRQNYFIDTLKYNETEYTVIDAAMQRNHGEAFKNNYMDFAHMQYSLAARLAYTLGYNLPCSNLGAGIITGNAISYTDEEVSYFAGWLGDATLIGDKKTTTSFGNDDYLSDLDAENLYQLILQNYSTIDAISNYYSSLSSDNTRAHVFIGHIAYDYIQSKVFYELIDDVLYKMMNNASKSNDIVTAMYYFELIHDEEYHWDTIKSDYPDTYNFLKSLNDLRATMGHYE